MLLIARLTRNSRGVLMYTSYSEITAQTENSNGFKIFWVEAQVFFLFFFAQ